MYDCLTLCLLVRSQRPVCVKTRQTGPVGKGLNDIKSAECAFLQLEKPQLTFSCFHHKKHQILPQNWSFQPKNHLMVEDLTSKQLNRHRRPIKIVQWTGKVWSSCLCTVIITQEQPGKISPNLVERLITWSLSKVKRSRSHNVSPAKTL